jgi:hypothetical protein
LAGREAIAGAEAKKEAAGKSGKEMSPDVAEAGKKDSAKVRYVRIVVGANKKMTFEGAETNWDGIEALLAKVPNRESTVLEVAIATDDVTVREMNDAIGAASHYGRTLRFKYTSYIGVHPIGSRGTGEEQPKPNGEGLSPKKDGGKGATSGSKLTLPNGGTVELVAVGPHDSKGETWWSPDGSPLKETPWTTWKNKDVDGNGGRLARKFAFRFRNMGENVDTGAWLLRVDGATGGQMVGAFDSAGKEVPGALTLAASFDPQVKMESISIGVAARPRRLVLRVDRSGKVISGIKEWTDAPTRVLTAEHKEPGQIGSRPGTNAEAFFGFLRPGFYEFDTTVVAIDIQGNKHYAFGFPIYHDDIGGDTIKRLDTDEGRLHYGSGFDIPLSRVKEFRVLARSHKLDYDWFTFENVSLEAGHRTEPKARVDQLVAPGPLSQRLVFKPQPGKAGETNWTMLGVWNDGSGKSVERVMANVTMDGEFPVQRPREKEPVFKVKLRSGTDESLKLLVTDSKGLAAEHAIERGKPLSLTLEGKTYQLLYPETSVGLEDPAETPFAVIIVTRKLEVAHEAKDGTSRKK